MKVNSYGFGQDYDLEALRRLMEGVPGSTVKPIFNTHDVQNTFSHIGELAQRIVANEAEFEFVFTKEVIAGDAFRYQPGTHYFGSIDQKSKLFRVSLRALERERTYTFCFEGRLLAQGAQDRQPIGVVSLKFRVSGTFQTLKTAIYINRTNESRRYSCPNEDMQTIFQILDASRSSDPLVQLQSLRARLAIYQREGADPELINLVKRSIEKMESGATLSETERRNLKADRSTQVGSSSSDRLHDMAETWLRLGYDSAWVKWLLSKARELNVKQDQSLLLNASTESEKRVLIEILDGRNPISTMSQTEREAFSKAIRA